MRGQGSGKKKKVEAALISSETLPSEPITVSAPSSVSQQSFVNKLQHFEKMIMLLQNVANYNPNEPDYQISNLQNSLSFLNALNNNANNSLVALKTARNDRDSFLYASNTGLVDLAKLSKAYIKGVYGSNSAECKAAMAIPFKKH